MNEIIVRLACMHCAICRFCMGADHLCNALCHTGPCEPRQPVTDRSAA